MNLPSIKKLESAFPGKGKVIRTLLESSKAVNEHPAVIAWVKQCYHEPKLHEKRLYAIDAELETHGVEYVEPGNNTRSPGFAYCNAGDTYATTIIHIDSGRYIVGCWGDIVERGNYN